MNTEKVRQKMTEKSFLLLFLLLVTVTIVRPFFIEQDIVFTYIGLGSSLVTGVIYLYLANTPSHHWHPYLFAAVSLCLLLPMIVITGGVNSHFVPILPLMPVLLCIIATRRTAQVLSALLIVFIIALHVLNGWLPGYEVIGVPKDVTEMRTLWLVLACVIGILFGSEFDKINRALGTKLLESSSKDGLTGVDNRVSVLENLESRLALSESKDEWLSVFIVDIDEFKAINKEYGSEISDLCLQQVARCIQHSVRGKDDLVGRYGAEEFLMVLQGADQSAAYKIAEKVRGLIGSLDLQREGEPIVVTATIGYCSMPTEQVHSAEQLLNAAEAALVAGKAKGINSVVGADQAVVTESYITNH